MARTSFPVICVVVCAAVLVPLDLATYEPSAEYVFDVITIILSAIGPVLLGTRLRNASPVLAQRLRWLGYAFIWVGTTDVAHRLGVDHGDAGAWWLRAAFAFDDTSYMVLLLALCSTVYRFPDGRTPSPRWARNSRRATVAMTVLLVASTLLPGEQEKVRGKPIPFPIPGTEHVGEWLDLPTLLVLFGILVGAALSVRWRYKRASGIERLQLLWLSYAAMFIPATIVTCLVDAYAFGDDDLLAAGLLLLSTPFAISVAVTVAITRYQLYAIDRLINRTLVYVVLTAALLLLYVALVLLVGLLLSGNDRTTTAIAVLGVALAFRPARDQAQNAVDRRFNRRRYNGLRRVQTFVEEVRAGRAEPEGIGPILARALDDTGLEVWFWLPATERFAAADGRLEDPPEDLRASTEVRRAELLLGVVLHDPRLGDRADTLDSVLRTATLAFEIARLRVELRVQLAEVEASRARIVAAAVQERKRLERDLHDGAQQRLVSLGLAVRHAQHVLGAEPDAARMALDGAVDEVTAALAELRELARGLRPALLDAGLGPALADVARRSPVPVELTVDPARHPEAVESAAYYVACEALTNAVKHAGATRVRVAVRERDGKLAIEIADDGRGGATATPGGGLTGLADRVAAHQGELRIASPAGAGTMISVELPCAS